MLKNIFSDKDISGTALWPNLSSVTYEIDRDFLSNVDRLLIFKSLKIISPLNS